MILSVPDNLCAVQSKYPFIETRTRICAFVLLLLIVVEPSWAEQGHSSISQKKRGLTDNKM